MVVKAIEDKRKEFIAVQKDLAQAVEQAKTAENEYDLSKVTVISGDDGAKRSALHELDERATALHAELRQLTEMQRIADNTAAREKAMSEPAQQVPNYYMMNAIPQQPQRQRLGDLVMKHETYKNRQRHADYRVEVDYDLNTLMTTSAGFGPESIRTGLVVPSAQRPVQVTDLFPMTETNQHAVTYMEETTFTNAAAEREESTAAAEAALAYTERTKPIRQIAVHLPVSEIQLEDKPRVASLISNRLPFMLRQRLDAQLVNGTSAGNGNENNIDGIIAAGPQSYDRTGGSSGSAVALEDIFKAAQVVRYSGTSDSYSEANGLIVDQTTATNIRLAKDTQNRYLFGDPSSGDRMVIWGLPYAVSNVLAANTAIVGDFANFAELVYRRGITVMQERNGTQFVTFATTVRADLRCALIVTRPAAFVHIVAP